MRCSQQKPILEEEFSNFMYKKVIETIMVEEENSSQDAYQGSQSRDVTQVTQFNAKHLQYTNLIRESVNLRMEFWRELLQKIPDIIKL